MISLNYSLSVPEVDFSLNYGLYLVPYQCRKWWRLYGYQTQAEIGQNPIEVDCDDMHSFRIRFRKTQPSRVMCWIKNQVFA